jgi:uncharacterized protein with PIN domain
MRFKTAELRFFGNLVDLVPGRRSVMERTFDVSPSVKDMIEACGVPHPEVDLVLVNGEAVGWGHAVRDGERISVYPRFYSFDVAELSAVHVPPPPEPRFVLDVHLTALAKYLRLLGLDTRAPPGAEDGELAAISTGERRWLLTRDLGLLKRSLVRHGYFVRTQDPLEQCIEVVRYFDLDEELAPFTRCMECNGAIQPVAADEVHKRLPPRVRANHDSFRECAGCLRPYWRGSHYEQLERTVDTVRFRAGRR